MTLGWSGKELPDIAAGALSRGTVTSGYKQMGERNAPKIHGYLTIM